MEKIAQAGNPRPSKGKKWFFFCHLANELVGSGGEGLEETTNTFGGFQTPFSVSTKDFCGASVEGMCILSVVFLSFPWTV